MSEKITLNLFCMGLLATLLSMLLSVSVLFQLYQQEVQEDLQAEGELIAAIYEEAGSSAVFSLFDSERLHISLVDAEGGAIYDNQSEGSALWDYCYTVQLSGGEVLQVSVQAIGLGRILGQCALLLLPLLLVLALLAVGIAWLLTRRLLKPISTLPSSIDDPLLAEDPKRVYPELAPFIRELQTQRREREAMRQEFTANVTHELKTPLTSISGYAEMISTGLARQDDIPRFAEKIRIESDRMQNLVNDIIELSKLDRATASEPQEQVNLLEVAQECSDQLSISAQQRGVILDVKGQGFTVLAEEKRLWELVYNLADNAIRYNRRGGWVRIWVSAAERALIVTDNGIGIPEEHQGRVFERFFRVDKSHSRATGGTGLGLSIVKHIAEQYGARITLKSAPNVGTEIRVSFPEA